MRYMESNMQWTQNWPMTGRKLSAERCRVRGSVGNEDRMRHNGNGVFNAVTAKGYLGLTKSNMGVKLSEHLSFTHTPSKSSKLPQNTIACRLMRTSAISSAAHLRRRLMPSMPSVVAPPFV